MHGLADAEAALAAAARLGVPLTLVSAPGGAESGGAGWFEAVVRRAAAAHPEVEVTAILDCGDRADLVQAALRQGLKDVCFRGPARIADRLADIARQRDARLHRRLPPALDLFGAADRAAACRRWLAGG
ncbi:MAG TPA: hypothetical protein VJJ77_07615 [Dongiaceae bacterium]|nr:hypothetical protein [Dongiaceae bacterium]